MAFADQQQRASRSLREGLRSSLQKLNPQKLTRNRFALPLEGKESVDEAHFGDPICQELIHSQLSIFDRAALLTRA